MDTSISYQFSLFFRKALYHFSRKPKTYGIVGASIVVIAGYFYFSSTEAPTETVTVTMGPLKQYVSVTGAVQASKDANLAFQTLGAVAYVGVKVGDVVSQGKVLATLDAGDAQANLLQAQAQLANAQATLGQLTQGARPEEVAIKQQVVDNAKNSLDQAYIAIPDAIRNVDATTADVIKNKLSSLFTNVGDHYVMSFSSCDQGYQSQIENNRSKIESTLADYQKKSSTISVISSKADIDAVFEQAYLATLSANDLINNISKLLYLPCSIQNTSLNDSRTTLSTVRTTMNTLFTDITTKRSALITAKNTLSQATRDLDFTKSGTDPYKLKAQSAVVAQAEASVAQARATLQKTVIYAPFTGTISDVSVSMGETVTSGKTVISMLAIDAFEIEAKVPEIDIIKIKSGEEVEVTLDAYGKAVLFPATVTRVNPTASIEGGVPMYKVIVTFTGNDKRIKSGMTANVKIITENKSNVLTLPARFVEVQDQSRGVVTVYKNRKNEKVKITLGSRGDNGLFEVIDGLVVGDIVVAPLTTMRAAQKQTQ